jgi:hypothetical protein
MRIIVTVGCAIYVAGIALAGWSVAGDAVGTEKPFAGALEVRHFSFEAQDDEDGDMQPDRWSRRRGPGFPNFVRARIDRSKASDGRQSLKFELDGAKLAYYSEPIAADHLHSYALRGKILCQGLRNDAALVTVSLLDRSRDRVERIESRAVTGTHSDWITIEIGPFRPGPDVRYLVVGCHIVQGERTDVQGTVWFDDLWLGCFPVLDLATNSQLPYFFPHEEVSIRAQIVGITPGANHRLVMTLDDGMGNVVEEKSFDDLDASLQVSPDDTPRLTDDWVPAKVPNGFYRVSAKLEREGQTILDRTTTFVVIDPTPETMAGEFGWSLASGPGQVKLANLAEIAARGGVNWLKMPLWSAERAEAKPGSYTSELTAFFDRLDQRGIHVVGLLSDPPPQLTDKYARHWVGISKIFTMPRDFWAPSLEPIVAQHSFRVRHWQLGSDTDDSFLGLGSLAETIGAVRTELGRVGCNPWVGFHWKHDEPLPSSRKLHQAFVSLGDAGEVDCDKMLAELKRTESSGIERWVLLAPPPKSGHEPRARAIDLARALLTAKLGKAQGIYARDPYDPETGLLNRDGSPTEMYLPWRTMALALRGATWIGTFSMPHRCRNAVFVRGHEVIVVIWNDHPTREEFFLGQNARAVDLWGGVTPLPVDPKTGNQTLDVGPAPLIVMGCSEPVARWRLATQFEQGKIGSEFGKHDDALLGVNTFGRNVSGKISVHFPPGWQIEPSQWNVNFAPNEKFRLPIQLEFPEAASLGALRPRIDFELVADRQYHFSVHLPYSLGLGDIEFFAEGYRTQTGEFEVVQTIVNNTDPVEILDFDCELFIPNRVRQRQFVRRLGQGEDQRVYVLQNPDQLRGQDLWLRATQKDGTRVLNCHLKVVD